MSPTPMQERFAAWLKRERAKKAPWERRAWRARYWPVRLMPSRARKFWQSVSKTDGCWLWSGPKVAHGYGQFTVFEGINVMAHRYAWELTHGMIPSKAECGVRYHVHHICQVKACVNPRHLQLIEPKAHRGLHKKAT